MVKKSWEDFAKTEHGFEKVKIFFPDPTAKPHPDSEFGVVRPGEEPSEIYLNPKTGEWFEDIEALFDEKGAFPDDY